MEGSHGERVRRAVEALNGQDRHAFLGIVDEDFVADWSRSTAPYAGLYEGRAGIEAMFDTLAEWDEVGLELLRLTECEGGAVVSELRGVFRGVSSGVEVSATGGVVWRFRGEAPVRFELFQSYEDAVVAAGETASPPR